MNLNNNDTKVHYKSYKSGKHWINAAIMTAAFIPLFALTQFYGNDTKASADQISSYSNNSETKYKLSDNNVQFLMADGSLAKGLVSIDGNEQYFDNNGNQVKGSIADVNGHRMYFDGASGNLVRNQFISYNGSYVYADNNGYLLIGLQDVNNQHLFFNDDGTQVKGQIVQVNGKQMYFSADSGELVTNQFVTVDGKSYHADLNGVLTEDNSKSEESLMTNSAFNQNYHYNTPRGFSNDIQSTVPHYVNNDPQTGKIDYYDVYFLYNPYPSDVRFSNEWYHATTKDFKTFSAFDKADPTSIKNVAIPYMKYHVNQMSDENKNNQDRMLWSYVATGSVLYNDGLLKQDTWGNKIDDHAKLAYFSAIDNKQEIFLMYSNNGEQYKPYQSQPVMSIDQIPSPNTGDFRDVVVQRSTTGNGKMYAYIAGGWEKKFYVFSSDDGVNWTHDPNQDVDVSKLNDKRLEVETPIVKTVNGQALLFFSWHSDNLRGNAYIKGYIDQDGVFKVDSDEKEFHQVDGDANQGDTYASNYAYLDKDGKNADALVNINWSGNWLYSPIGTPAYDDLTKHAGTITLPRLIQYDSNTKSLIYIPIEPNSKLVNSYRIISDNNSLLANVNNKYDFTFDDSKSPKVITLKRAESTITITVDNNGITVNRQSNLNPKMDKDVTTPLSTTDITKMQLYVDNSTVEVYLPEANESYNIVNYTSQQNEPYTMSVQGKSNIDNYQFGGYAASISSDSVSNNIQAVRNDLKGDNGLLDNISDANKNQANNYYKQANAALDKASQYLTTANNKDKDDATQLLYLDIANYNYLQAKSLENKLAALIMDISNSSSNNGRNNQTGFDTINGNTVYFDNGIRKTGLLNNNYFDDQTGYEVKNTVVIINDGTYYFDANGNMLKDNFEVINNDSDITPNYGTRKYYFGDDGKAVKGQITVNGDKYYADGNYLIVNNDIVKNDDGTLSYYGTDGKLATNTILGNDSLTINGDGIIQGDDTFVQSPINAKIFYYLKGNHIQTGYINSMGNAYIFDDNGLPELNQFKYDDNGKILYYVASNGRLARNQFIQASTNGPFYYFGNDNKAVFGNQTIDGNKMYFDNNGYQVKGGFVENADGTYSYYDQGNGNLAIGKVKVGSRTLYFDDNGEQVKGRFAENANGTYSYYDKNSGDMLVGKVNIEGRSLYFDDNGEQVKGRFAENANGTYSYYDKNSGDMLVGKVNIEGRSLYFDDNGEQVKGRFAENANGTYSYYDKNSGDMLVGKVNIEGRSLYFDDNGEQVKGRFAENANGTYSYYDKNSGDMLVGKVNIEGRSLYFDDNGEQVKGRFAENANGTYSYYDKNSGDMLVGKVNIEGRSLYFDDNGEQVKGRFVRNANGTYSYYDKNSGDMLVGKVNIEGHSLYFDDNGEQVKGRFVRNDNGTYSYYDKNSGDMLVGKVNIEGRSLYFDRNGEQVKGRFIRNANGTYSYYDKNSGDMLVGKVNIEGRSLYFDRNGEQVKGRAIQNLDGSYSYYDKNSGDLVTNHDDVSDEKTSFKKGETIKGHNTIKTPKRSELHALNQKLASDKKQLSRQRRQLTRLKNSLKKKHTKKTKKILSTQYNKLLKKYNKGKKAYNKLNKKKTGLATYFKNVASVNKAKKELASAKSQEDKAKKMLKEHNTKKNRAALKKLKTKVTKINKTISKNNKSINAFKHSYK
ncbi:hypothetical protein AKUH3B110M_12740 [Apilactobacillus kunkeei]|nr:hypothetical protein AKUH3B207X_12770 [Apilactobacillus kunkeei]CAI2650106.1 hypothetical protein AKUH4B205J_12980 [Apilactobacillus kunkeei]CAI2652158.1 hypothetical protein AKUH3B110M_12740 [Apilactobacillus kunkeei]CAI2691915.1 hypothetical protein AKUH3B103J_12770 [Apilactobacillus kunkeei]